MYPMYRPTRYKTRRQYHYTNQCETPIKLTPLNSDRTFAVITTP